MQRSVLARSLITLAGYDSRSILRMRTFIVISMAVFWLGFAVVKEGEASPLFLAQFEATVEGVGDLPATVVTGAYLFEDAPPIFIDDAMTEAHYQAMSWTVTVGGIPFSAAPSTLEVENDVPALFDDVSRDAYAATASLSGTYLTDFRLLGVGVEFVKFGAPPLALIDLSLPTSVADLSGFTEEGPLDHRVVVLAFENLSTGDLFAAAGPISELTISPVPEPSAVLLLGAGLIFLGGRSHLRTAATGAWRLRTRGRGARHGGMVRQAAGRQCLNP